MRPLAAFSSFSSLISSLCSRELPTHFHQRTPWTTDIEELCERCYRHYNKYYDDDPPSKGPYRKDEPDGNLGQCVERFLGENSDLFSYVKPTAGCVMFVEFKGPLTSTELGDALAADGISIKPSYCFTDDDSVDQYFRIGFGEEKVPAAIEALARFVAAKRGEWGFPRV